MGQHRWNSETAKAASLKGVEVRFKDKKPSDYTIHCEVCSTLFCAIRIETKRGRTVIRPAYDRTACCTQHGYEVVRRRNKERHTQRRLQREPTACAVCGTLFTPISVTKKLEIKIVNTRVVCSTECSNERKRNGRAIAAERKTAKQAEIDALIKSWTAEGEDREWKLRRAAAISAAGW